jgi:uncharacterized protein DUF6496
MARMSPKSRSEHRNKVQKVMQELKEGTLRSSSGDKVTSRDQAIAIGLSEQRRAEGKGARKPKKRKPRY